MSAQRTAFSTCKLLCTSAPLALIAAAPAAYAQQRNYEPLETIIVTATKRPELLTDVPIAISALSGDRLVQMGADRFEDYARTIPSLSFVDNGPSKGKVVLRGVTTSVGPDANDTTGIYFDEVPVGSSGRTPDLRLFDIERIEVLRGPQGTLYGSGSMGGTLRVIPNRADATAFSGSAETTVSSTHEGGDNWGGSGVLNMPIVADKLALRVVGYYRDYDGFVDNPTLGLDNVNDEKSKGGRMSLRWTPSEHTAVALNVLRQESEYGARNHYTPAFGDLVQRQQSLEPLNDTFTFYNLTANTVLGSIRVDSSTSYFEREVFEIRDYSAALGLPDGLLYDFYFDERFAQELRLSSDGDGRLHWIVGGFYEDRKAGTPQRATVEFTPGVVTVLLDGSVAYTKNEQAALFGEISYDLTSSLTATAGLRYFDVNQKQHVELQGNTFLYPNPVTLDGGSSGDGVNPKFVLSYRPQEGRLVYASAAKGFRQGGPTGLGTPPGSVPTQYDSDSLWNYELGSKLEMLGGRLAINTALFYIDWSDIQTTVVSPSNIFYTTNAGSASIKGIELELALRATDQLDLLFSGSLLDPQLEESQSPPNDGLDGQRIPGVPRESFSASARYSFPLSAALQAFASAGYQYVGNTTNGFRLAFGSAATTDLQPSYGLGNVRLGVQTDKYEIALFADNVTDERAVLFYNRSFRDIRVQTNRPRTIGVTARFNF